MNKRLKAALKKEWEAPAPQRKKEFLRKLPTAPLSHFSFVCSQAVSYTHLDVYKRQVSGFPLFLARVFLRGFFCSIC